MGVGRRSSAKSSASHLSVKPHLLRFYSKDLSNSHLVDGLELRTGPNLCAVAVVPDGRVQWFHWGVRQIWKFIFSDNSAGSCEAFYCFSISACDRTEAGGSRQFFVTSQQT